MKRWEKKNLPDRNWPFWSGFGRWFWAFCETNSVGSILQILDFVQRGGIRTPEFSAGLPGGSGGLSHGDQAPLDRLAKLRNKANPVGSYLRGSDFENGVRPGFGPSFGPDVLQCSTQACITEV